MKFQRFAVSLAMLCALLNACSAGHSAAATPVTQASMSVGEPEPPSMNWDHPFRSEGRQNVDPAAIQTAPESYGLSIRPVTPALSPGKLRWADISAAGTVAYMFDFSADTSFPPDARVVVEESPSDMTQDEYVDGGTWAGTDNTVTPVGLIKILVRSYQGVAEASFVDAGSLYVVKGPALGPAPALDLATQLAHQLSATS